MRRTAWAGLGMVAVLAFGGLAPADDPGEVRSTTLAGPDGLTLTVRMQGPYDADVPLQVVCYFRHRPEGDTTRGAAVELDRRLGGVIAALRDRGEFAGEALETLLLTPPAGAIRPAQLLLVGLGDEGTLTLERLEGVGRLAFREAARLGVKRVAFAPLIRDQGNERFTTGAVAAAVTAGMLRARETQRRLHAEGLAPVPPVEEWIAEAGPTYFDETVTQIRDALMAVEAARAAAPARPDRQAAR